MKTQFCTTLKNSTTVIDLAVSQLKDAVEQLDDETKAILNVGEVAASMAKLKYNIDHLDEHMFTAGT